MIIEIDTAAFNPEGVSEVEKIHDTPSGFGFQYAFFATIISSLRD